MTENALLAVAGYSTSGTGRGRGIELLALRSDGQGLAVERRAAVEVEQQEEVVVEVHRRVFFRTGSR